MKISLLLTSLLFAAPSFAQPEEIDGEVSIGRQVEYATEFRLMSSQTIKPNQSSIEFWSNNSDSLVGRCSLNFKKKAYTRSIGSNQVLVTELALSVVEDMDDEYIRKALLELRATPEAVAKLSSREELLVMLGQLGGKLRSNTLNYIYLGARDGSFSLTCETAKPMTNIGEFIEAASESHSSNFIFDRAFP